MAKRIIRLTEGQLYDLIKEVLITEMGRVPTSVADYSASEKKKILEVFQEILRGHGFKGEYIEFYNVKDPLDGRDIDPYASLWDIFVTCVNRDIQRRNELLGGFTEKKRDAAIKCISLLLNIHEEAVRTLWYKGIDEMFRELKSHHYALDKRYYRNKGMIY